MYDCGNDNLSNLLDLLGIILGVENLRLNEQQSKELMSELYTTQDSMLKTIIKQNEIIIAQNEKLLRELKNLRK